MRVHVARCVVAGLLTASGAACASADLLRTHNCVACHSTERKMIGPALKDVAAKHRADSEAVDKLAKKIKNGGGGVWGEMPMPPQPQVSDADALTLARYVMSIQ